MPKNAFHRLEPHVQDFIRQELSTHTSPEDISGRLQLEFDVFVSKNTLYRYIQQERQAGGELYQQLPHRGKRYSYSAENLKRLFPTLALNISQLKPNSNRNLAISRLTPFWKTEVIPAHSRR
ncbi:hypothetical protein EWM60_15155 [Candidatus Erwinia dacicola]|nr:hypothetical protein [Candidatus Erwinia dacicola]